MTDEIRVVELPEEIDEIGRGGSSTVSIFRMESDMIAAGKKVDINLFITNAHEKQKLQKVNEEKNYHIQC
jgi:hypothetical protein